MKKFARVFFKGNMQCWFDFPLGENGTLMGFMQGARLEGGAMMEAGFLPFDCFGPVVMIQAAEGPAMPPQWATQPAGRPQ